MAAKKLGLIPKTTKDKVALLLLLHGGPHMLYYELGLVLPSYIFSEHLYMYLLNSFVLTAVVVMAYVQLFKMRTANIAVQSEEKSSKQSIYDENLKDYNTKQNNTRHQWDCRTKEEVKLKYCSVCDIHYPPRTHHCKICDVCILKRDHHCWFAGVCVGNGNQYHYIGLILCLWLIALYGNIMNIQFNAHHLFGYSIWTLLSIPMPHIYFVLGWYSMFQFYVACLMTIGVTLFAIFSLLLWTQLVQLYHGQTKYEREKGVTDYDLGPSQNFKEVFGENSWFAYIFCKIMVLKRNIWKYKNAEKFS